MIGPGDAAIAWAEEKREFADELEAYAPAEAAKIRKLVDELEARVLPLIPIWVLIGDVSRAKGLSLATLRKRAHELAAHDPPRARKNASGIWEIHRDAVTAIPARHRSRPLPAGADVNELAEHLGREV